MSSADGQFHVPHGARLRSAAGRVVFCALFVAGLAAPSLAAALPASAQAGGVAFTTAEAVPADAATYVVATTDDRSEQWRLADTLLDRAGFGEVIDQAVAEEMQNESGEDLPLDAFLGGEVAIVLSGDALDTLMQESMAGADFESMLTGMDDGDEEADAGPEMMGFSVILDARAPDTAWAGIRDSAAEDAAEETTYEGTTIIYAPPADADSEGMAAARVADHILLATAPEDLHPLIDTADGRTPNITTVPEFTTARDALPADFLAFTFSNSIADLDIELGPFEALMGGLIVDAYSASTIAADEAGFRLETVTIPGADATLPPVSPSFESELVDVAPDNALLFMSGPNLGETGVLDALGAMLIGLAFGMGDPSMMDEATPEADASSEDAIAQQYEDAAAMLGVNLQTDLFRQFVGEYGGWLSANAEAEEISGLWTSEVDDPDTVANALMQISFLIQGASGSETPLTTREADGGQVYVIELDDAGSTLEFGVVGDRFVIGEGSAVARLTGDAGDALSGNAQFQAVMDTLPVEGNGTFYVDLAQAIPLMEVASEQADDLGMAGMGEITDAHESCADYATQEEAQAAYDAFEPETFDLDQDFDGQACEDFFAAPATGDDLAADEGTDDIEAALEEIDYSAIKAFAVVSHEEDGLQRSSGILYISE